MKTAILTTAATLLFSLAAIAGESIAVADLPKSVTDAIEARYTGAKLIAAEKEVKKGQVVYEVDIRHNDVSRDLDVAEDGKILKDKVDD